MGQSTSAAGNSILNRRRSKSFTLKFPIESIESEISQPDYTSSLPDECLALVFQFLNSGNRKRCALVCRRWMIVEGQNRYRLSLHARSDLITSIPSLFSRFDSVTKLSLKCDRRSVSIGDEALVKISLRCRNLKRLKLRACRELTDVGMAAFAENCKDLKIFSCGSCDFGAKGVKAVLDHCSNLEELSIKRLRGFTDIAPEMIGPGVAASSLKSICLKELYNGQCFGPVIVGAKNLKSLKLFRCSGDWDLLLQEMSAKCPALRKLCIKNCPISDVGIENLANGCPGLTKVKIKKCKGVLGGCADWLRTVRPMLSVNADTMEQEHEEAASNDVVGGSQENGIEFPQLNSQIMASSIASSSRNRSGYFKSGIGLFSGMSLVPCTSRQRRASREVLIKIPRLRG